MVLLRRSNAVIGRLHQHDSVLFARREPQGGCRYCRAGIAPLRLEHDPLRFDANFAQLFLNEKPVLLVADEQRRIEADVRLVPFGRLLQQRTIGRQWQ